MKRIHLSISPLLLLLLLFAGSASAGTADVTQIGDTIYVWGNGHANLTYIEAQVSNASALTHTGTIFLAGANINVNGTGTILHINDTDCTWLKLNSTDGDVSDFRCDGYFEMNNSKITSWNTTTSAIVGQTAATMSTTRPNIRFGKIGSNAHVNISNSNISYLGDNSTEAAWGMYFIECEDSTISNTSLSYMYSIYMTCCDRFTFSNVNIFNNSFYAAEFYSTNNNITIVDSDIYYNGWLAELQRYYGGGGIRVDGLASTDFVIDDTDIHDGFGALTFFDPNAAGFILKNSRIYNATDRGVEFNIAPGGICENNTVYNIEDKALYNVYNNDQTFRNNTVYDSKYGIQLYQVSDVDHKVYDNTFYNNEYNLYFYHANTHDSVVDNNTISGAGTVYDIRVTDNAKRNTLQDTTVSDNDLTMQIRYTLGSIFVNYTDNKIMSNSTSAEAPGVDNVYYADHSSLFVNSTHSNTLITVYLYNGTLTPKTTNVTISAVNAWVETSGSESYNITVNSANASEICTFTAETANTSDWYGCYVDDVWSENNQALDSMVSWEYAGGFAAEHDLMMVWNMTITVAAKHTPPTPTNLQNTTGNFWVNHTWQAGSGNVTDSYNITINSVWHNITNAYYNNTGLSAHAWSNATVYAYNSSGTGTLSAASISQNTQIPNNPIAITNYSDQTAAVGDNVSVDLNYADLDGDTPTFSCSRTDLFTDFDTATGTGNWTSATNGTHEIDFGVSDGHGSTDNCTITVQVGGITITESPMPIQMFALMFGMMILLIFYSFIRVDENNYTHILTAFAGGILSILLGLEVFDGIDFYGSTGHLASCSTGWIGLFLCAFGGIMILYAVVHAIDVIRTASEKL